MSITLKYYPRVIYGVGGDTVTFTVDAEGVASYQWQVGGTNGANWTNLTWSGNKTATMTRALNVTTATYQYRCALTDADGAVVYAGPIKIAPPTDKGLISGDALTAIADAIRAKTETTDKILPADMAAMIEGLSEFEVISGSFTLDSYNGVSVDLGVLLPDSDTYLFTCGLGVGQESSNSMIITTISAKIDGTQEGKTLYNNGSSVLYVDEGCTLSNGDAVTTLINPSSYSFIRNSKYEWWYVYG